MVFSCKNCYGVHQSCLARKLDSGPEWSTWVNAKESHENYIWIFRNLDYNGLLFIAHIDILEDRRELTHRFFKCNVLPHSSCLHHLLPGRRAPEVISRLRPPNNYKHYVAWTEKFMRSFLSYCVNNYCMWHFVTLWEFYKCFIVLYCLIFLPYLIQPSAATL